VSGYVKGRVRYRGKETAINGFGFRDHSWGPRDWDNVQLGHRWLTGTVGPEFSFFALVHQAMDGKVTTMGYIDRKGVATYTDDIDVVVYMEIDGVTHRGGRVKFNMPDGEVIDIACRPIAGGGIWPRKVVAIVDILCEFEWEGRKGYLDFEISNNPRNGRGPLTLAVNATDKNGFGKLPEIRSL
jgi:hypothetical protein